MIIIYYTKCKYVYGLEKSCARGANTAEDPQDRTREIFIKL